MNTQVGRPTCSAERLTEDGARATYLVFIALKEKLPGLTNDQLVALTAAAIQESSTAFLATAVFDLGTTINDGLRGVAVGLENISAATELPT